MNTPFDELRTLFSINYPPPIPQEVNLLINSFVTILRTIYIQQSENANTLLYSYRTPLTNEIAEGINNAHILCRLSYFQFIEQLNIFGRVFSKKMSLSLPLYPRIYFFRNKIIEHWDDYMQFLPSNTIQMSSVKQTTTVMIPFIMGRGVIPDHREQTRNDLIRIFAKHNVTLSVNDNDWYGDFSEKAFVALEMIDPQLKKVPAEVVNALFDYMFPTPITDIESYSINLVQLLKSIIL